MTDFHFEILQPGDISHAICIADWYFQEWKIPKEKTLQRLHAITTDVVQFQAIMLLQGIPVATGGLYHHVGLLDKEPRFNVHRHWLALVYTVPEKRQQGLGAQLCTYIQEHAHTRGVKEMHLFTDTAERLYQRLGWQAIERVVLGERKVVVMKKKL
jgi:GNAT superfamily N-acetyltransferase